MTSTAKHYTNATRDENDVYLLILHSSSSRGTAEEMRQYFARGERQVSYHYIIDAQGHTVVSVDPQDIAYHAGNWDTNKRSIGIGLIGVAGQHSFPAAQLKALVALMAKLSHDFDLSLKRVHDYIDGRAYLRFGVAQHANVPGADHTDISPRFPIRDICAHARSLRNVKYGVPKVEHG
jgi:N-acetyl-anhydromuramyl-L-alanine amidase AmpD